MSCPLITLSDGVNSVNLPGDLIWLEHFGWSPVVQQVGYTLTGALVVETATKQAGKPITLQSGENFAVVDKTTVDQLMGWAAVAGKTLTLLAHGTTFNVMLRHDDAPAVEALLLQPGRNPIVSADLFRITIKLMEI